MTGKRGKLFVGTSGYQYNHWRGVFYPQKLPKKQWFEYYCKFFFNNDADGYAVQNAQDLLTHIA